jgi:diguanylate cyclase (GGDEF)-like protein
MRSVVNRSLKFGIGHRIAVLVSVAVAITVLSVSGLLTAYQVHQSVSLKRSSVEGTAYVFASAVADHIQVQDAHHIRTVLRSIDRVPGVVSASVYNAQGKVIASLGQRAILVADMAKADPGFWDMMQSGMVNVSVNIVKSGKSAGTLLIVTDISDLRAQFLRTMSVVLAASLLAALVSIMLSLPLQRRITNPISQLTQTMLQLKESRNYSTTVTTSAKDETGVMVEAFNSLIADIRFRDQSLQKLAYFDSLSGLPNRSNFLKTLEERLAALQVDGVCIGIVMLNIDAFHTYNDAFGHSIGDAILLNVAAVLRDEAGPQVFVARVGGDEFAMIVEDNGIGQEVEATIARIQSAFFQPLKFLHMELHLSISVGYTLLPRDSNTVGDAMRHVDLATNAAKKLGPGRAVVFRTDMDDKVRRETDMIQGLRQSIGNRELQIHFQPQFHAVRGKVVGFEALLRWNHPTFGYVSPTVFIPLAEKSGSIIQIGDWVLQESCRQAKAWIDIGETPRSIAVNVSPAQILQSGFVTKVSSILTQTGLPPHLLCLELTESLFLGRSLASVHSILDELHQLGVSLALDDFGTGYSSLAYLSALPFDKLKIDRSFVSVVHDSPRRLEILRSIIEMAHCLGMEIVAEGAETEEEIQLLCDLKADQVQGYAVSRPTVAKDAIIAAKQIEAAAAEHRSEAMRQMA